MKSKHKMTLAGSHSIEQGNYRRLLMKKRVVIQNKLLKYKEKFTKPLIL